MPHLPLWAMVLAYVAYSTAVNTMPEPRPTQSVWYEWLYRFAHAFAGNLKTAFGRIGREPWAGELPGQGTPPEK